MEPETTQEKLARLRTMMAAERTFAAWLRTGLAAIAGGLAIIKFIPFSTSTHQILSHLASILLMLWGILIIIFNLKTFTTYLSELNKDNIYKSHINRIMVFTILLLIAAILLLMILIPVL